MSLLFDCVRVCVCRRVYVAFRMCVIKDSYIEDVFEFCIRKVQKRHISDAYMHFWGLHGTWL